MRGHTAAILAAAGLVVLAAGWFFGTRKEPVEQISLPSGSPVFPNFVAHLSDATKLEITHKGQTITIEKRPDDKWGLANMGDYPVDQGRLRGVFAGLTELRFVERRTADPAQFARLGVDDAGGDLLRLVDGSGKTLDSLIVGHTQNQSRGDLVPRMYVRRPGDNQSWLAEGTLRMEDNPARWLDRNIVNIGPEQIVSMTTSTGLAFGLIAGRWALVKPADPPALEGYKVADVESALDQVTFEQVKPDASLQADPAGDSVFTTKDGLAVTVHVFHAGKDIWARFAAAASSDKVQAEVDRLNGLWSGWSYQLGSWKETSLVPALDDLKAPPPKPAASQAAPTEPAPSGPSLPEPSPSEPSPSEPAKQ